jgi:hypothetical protein
LDGNLLDLSKISLGDEQDQQSDHDQQQLAQQKEEE